MEIQEAVLALTVRLKKADPKFGAVKAVTRGGVSGIEVQLKTLNIADSLRPIIDTFAQETGIPVKFISPDKVKYLEH